MGKRKIKIFWLLENVCHVPVSIPVFAASQGEVLRRRGRVLQIHGI